MGTSCDGTPVQTPFHKPRLTSPCDLLTPLECRLKRNARIVMLNGSLALTRVWPKEKNSSKGRPISTAKLPKYLRIISRGKESLPAGTGVLVVKTLAEAATWRAV